MNSPSPSDRLPKQSVIELPEDKSLRELLKAEGFTELEFRDVLESLGHDAYVNALFLGLDFKISHYPEESNVRIAISVGLKALRDNLQQLRRPTTGAYRLIESQVDLASKTPRSIFNCDFDVWVASLQSRQTFSDISLKILQAFWGSRLDLISQEAPDTYRTFLHFIRSQDLVPRAPLTDTRSGVAGVISSASGDISSSPATNEEHQKRDRLTVDELKRYLNEMDKENSSGPGDIS